MKIFNIDVGLEGIADIMFDKFIDHSKEPRPADQKLYLVEGNKVVLPAMNIKAFLFNQKGNSCATKFEGKLRNNYISIGESHVSISPQNIPFLDNKGNPTIFSDFNDGVFYVVTASPTTKLPGGGIIKQPAKPRPVLKLPWKLDFQIHLVKNDLINEGKLHNWFDGGGILIALGTYRPTYGRFRVYKWKVK
jgi:hypothetical protein